MQSTKKRSYPKSKKALPYKKRVTKNKGITAKYSAKKKREIKTVDILFTNAYNRTYTAQGFTKITLNDEPTLQNLVTVNQGAGICNRIGNKIALKSLRFRCSLYPTGNNAGQGISYQTRFMIIYDRQPNGTYPTFTEILGDMLVTNTIVQGDYISSINPTNFDRFIVLCDKMISIGQSVSGVLGLGQTTETSQGIDEFIKLKGLETVFKASTSQSPIADIATGALYVLTQAETMPSGNEDWCLDSKFRLRFYDN